MQLSMRRYRLGVKVAVHSHSDLGARMAVEAGAELHPTRQFHDDPHAAAHEEVRHLARCRSPGCGIWQCAQCDWLQRRAAQEGAGQTYDPFIRMTRSAIRIGVKIAFGTDAGEYPLGENGSSSRCWFERECRPRKHFNQRPFARLSYWVWKTASAPLRQSG